MTIKRSKTRKSKSTKKNTTRHMRRKNRAHKNRKHRGGIGVSGAMDHQDLECVDAALRSVGLKAAPNNMAEH